jgi:hypothetical protein
MKQENPKLAASEQYCRVLFEFGKNKGATGTMTI